MICSDFSVSAFLSRNSLIFLVKHSIKLTFKQHLYLLTKVWTAAHIIYMERDFMDMLSTDAGLGRLTFELRS